MCLYRIGQLLGIGLLLWLFIAFRGREISIEIPTHIELPTSVGITKGSGEREIDIAFTFTRSAPNNSMNGRYSSSLITKGNLCISNGSEVLYQPVLGALQYWRVYIQELPFTVTQIRQNCIGSISFGSLHPSERGVAELHTSQGLVVQADVTISTTLKSDCYEAVLAHEFGHLLGLGHTDTGIMRGGFCGSPPAPSAQSLKALQLILQR